MPTSKWKAFRKSLSSLRSKFRIGSHKDLSAEIDRMESTSKQNSRVVKDEYDLNYGKLVTFGKDPRIAKTEKFIAVSDKSKLPPKVKEYYEFLKKKTYEEYVNDKFGGDTRAEFLRETASSTHQSARWLKEDKSPDPTITSRFIKEFWKYIDKSTSIAQKKVMEINAFKNKVEELVKLAVIEIQGVEQRKRSAIGISQSAHNPRLVDELTQKLSKSKR